MFEKHKDGWPNRMGTTATGTTADLQFPKRVKTPKGLSR